MGKCESLRGNKRQQGWKREVAGSRVEQELGGAKNKTLRENKIQVQNEGLSSEEDSETRGFFGERKILAETEIRDINYSRATLLNGCNGCKDKVHIYNVW